MSLKKKLYIIVFYTNTRAGRFFDQALLWAILISILTVLLESVESLNERHGALFEGVEWFFTLLFTFEYILRIYISPKPSNYIFSFWGVIDFLAAIPLYVSLFYPGAQFLFVIRFLRFLRVFRVMKLARFTSEAKALSVALRSSMYKITIFFTSILILVLLLGTLMYVVEGRGDGFDSIPESIYWAIITITTVGYGDLVPQTSLGKFISSVVMIIGYAIIAVPTGIVTSEMSKNRKESTGCLKCGNPNPDDARYCNKCGEKI
ncbi:ion transporter [Marinilabilia rubra]|uniref:Ion transporter n=1 Tax=Marinilabilia rubra TaxID=2162893 RepID=A0A2U2BAX4_9BACT|nr:ion transporter [Marinilabilia rubra]PWE00209.1 ion transporter [Marinilabilia rubra]